MPIDPEAIQRFLDKPVPYALPFKGVAPQKLLNMIWNCTGVEFKPGKTTLRKHQLEGLAFALFHWKALLLYQMQLGKSMIALNWAQQLRRSGLWRGKGLVIAHAPIGLDVWKAEADKHCDLKLFCVRSAKEGLFDAVDSDCDLIVIPWTGLAALFSIKRLNRKGRNQLYPDSKTINILTDMFDLCIIDEIHRGKDHTSLWFNIAAQLVDRCKFRLGLTGTTIGRDPFAIWSQAFLIDGGRTLGLNYYFFEQAFGMREKNWFSPLRMWVKDPKTGESKEVHYRWAFDKTKMPLMRRKLQSIALSYDRSEVEQSAIEPHVVEISMTKAQRDEYNKAVLKVVKAQENVEVTAMHHGFIRLRQIASGFLPHIKGTGEQVTIEFPDSAKLQWLADMLDDLDDQARMVIFHEFVYSGRMISQLLTKKKISHVWLHGSSPNKAELVRKFQTGKAQLMVANTATGGMSINLSMADYLTYYECPTSPVIRAQADARPMADRGMRPLLIGDVICAPVERRILGFIKEGKDALTALARMNPRDLMLEGEVGIYKPKAKGDKHGARRRTTG